MTGSPGGRKGNCWDNAVVESFFKTLKSELVNHTHVETRAAARLATFEYIEGCGAARRYYRRRKHSVLNYRTPCEQESYFFTSSMAA
ncbi:integrase core domain-containing protein [Spirosoma daeguense]